MELEALQNNLEAFETKGAKLIALCPQRQEYNDATAAELQLGFPVLQDSDNLVASAFGLTVKMPSAVIETERFLGLDLPNYNDTDNWDLPIPSRYVIDRSSVVRYASHHIDHRMRRDPKECFECLDCH